MRNMKNFWLMGVLMNEQKEETNTFKEAATFFGFLFGGLWLGPLIFYAIIRSFSWLFGTYPFELWLDWVRYWNPYT